MISIQLKFHFTKNKDKYLDTKNLTWDATTHYHNFVCCINTISNRQHYAICSIYMVDVIALSRHVVIPKRYRYKLIVERREPLFPDKEPLLKMSNLIVLFRQWVGNLQLVDQGQNWSINWGCVCINVLPDRFLFKLIQKQLIAKEIHWAEHKYMNIHTPINALVDACLSLLL